MTDLTNYFTSFKEEIFEFLRNKGIESALFILFNFYKKIHEKTIEYVNLAREGNYSKIFNELQKIKNEVSENLNEIWLENDFYLNVRKFLAKDHLNYFDKKFKEDVYALEMFECTKGSKFIFVSFLEGCKDRKKLIEKYDLFNENGKF